MTTDDLNSSCETCRVASVNGRGPGILDDFAQNPMEMTQYRCDRTFCLVREDAQIPTREVRFHRRNDGIQSIDIKIAVVSDTGLGTFCKESGRGHLTTRPLWRWQ